MAEVSLTSLRETRAIHVEWRAFELRPGGKFPGTPEEEARYRDFILEKHTHMWEIARERFGLEMIEGPWGVNSRPAMEGAFFARAAGKERPYHRACFRAHWQETRRLDDLDTLVTIARSVGLDAVAFHQAVTQGMYRSELEADLALAQGYGVQAIPTFIFGDRYRVSGAQPVEVLQGVVDRCVAEGYVERAPR